MGSSSVGTGAQLVIDSLQKYQDALQSLKLTERVTPVIADGSVDEMVAAAPGLDYPASFPANFPSVKRIPGTRFIVDGFRNAGPWSVSYFLSHFHSDHYTGLSNVWNKGLVFCSDITAHLVRDSLQVPEILVVSLSIGTTVIVDGCEVTLVDANHCPGAVQFLFRIPEEGDGEHGGWHRYVHCGDMRYSPAMKTDASLCDFVGADAVFLDTTYCNPKFVFPPQETSVEYVAETIYRLMEPDSRGTIPDEDVSPDGESNENTDPSEDGSDEDEKVDLEGEKVDELSRNNGHEEEEPLSGGRATREIGSECQGEEEDPLNDGRTMEDVVGGCQLNGRATLFLISTYVIGKEKILTAVAKRCNCSIYVTEKKLTILKHLGIEEIGVFTTDPAATNVHVVKWSFLGETWPYFRPNFVNMEKALLEGRYRRVVGFVPTGWTYELKKKSFSVRKKGPFEIHLVPYSEHSNYDELREYVGFLRPKQIIPTVGLEGGGMDSKAVGTMRKHFRNLVDETASKRRFLKGFRRKPLEENVTSLDCVSPVKASKSALGPKAVFGLGARKRKRETDHGFLEDPVEPLYNSKTSTEIIQSAMLASTGSPQELQPRLLGPQDENVHVGDLGTAMELSVAYVEDGSRSTLSTSMEDGVYKQEGGGQFKLPKKHGGGQVDPSQIGVHSVKGNRHSQIRLADIAHISSSQKDLASRSKSSRGAQGKAPATKKKPSTGKKVKKSSTSPLPFKKATTTQSPASSAALFSRNSKATQSSILNFFRKSGDDVRSSVGEVDNGKQTMKVMEIDNLDRVLVSDAKGSNFDSSRVLSDVNKWADEYEQLASILDGDLSKDQAHSLLEKAGGNVGVALDLFYMDQNVHGAGGPSSNSQGATPMESQSLDQGRQGVLGSKSAILSSVEVAPETSPHKDILTSETGKSQLQKSKWVAEYEQLASILDGNVSEEDAHALLEAAGGNVAVALDSFYKKRSTIYERRPSDKLDQPLLGKGKHEPGVCSEVITSSIQKDQVVSPLKISARVPKPVPSSALASSIVKHSDSPMVKDAVEKKSSAVAVPVGKYIPLEHACWKMGEPAPYLHLARAFDLIEQESGRLRTADMLCNMFRSLLALSPEAVLPAVYLTTNRIAPDFESGELSIGGSLVTSAITEATGVSRAKLREMYTSIGDLGILSCVTLEDDIKYSDC